MAERSGLSAEAKQELADALWHAASDRVAIPQPSAAHPELTLADAYEVQRINTQRRLDRGERFIGRKIGLTSLAMQQQLGVDQPDYGVLTDAMVIPDGGVIAVAELVAPKLEPEYAFRIDTELPPNPSLAQIDAAIGAVAVAIEVIDSRIADWRIGLVDTVADNASSAAIVVGDWVDATPELLARIIATDITMTRDGETVAQGPGSAVLGDPRAAVHWLAEAIGAFGDGIAAGSTVLAGAVAAAVVVEPGARWQAGAEGFAPVTVLTE